MVADYHSLITDYHRLWAAAELVTNVVGSFITSDPCEASLLGFLWYVRQCGGSSRMGTITNGAQERKFKGGAQQICEKIAKSLGDSAVILNSPVVSINQSSKDNVQVKTLNGKEYKSKYIILACPPIVQMKIHFNPPLPPVRNQLIQRMPMGTVMKVVLYYRSQFWKDKGLCGSTFIRGGDEHPMYFSLNDTKPDGSYPAIIGQLQTTGTAIPGFSSGRPRKPHPQMTGTLSYRPEDIGGSQREKSLDTTQATGRPISRFTVARRLHGGGLFVRRPVPLTPAHGRKAFSVVPGTPELERQ
ncbi:amine oxidase [Trichonephila clavipes]|nr:amine oxidase [Trichonephila clavipes]